MPLNTVPIRVRVGDKRPIRALAVERTILEEGKLVTKYSCATKKFFSQAKEDYPSDWFDLLALLDETARHGPPQNTDLFRGLSDGLYEFKTWHLRLLCFFDDGSLIICTHGYLKSGQKADPQELNRARRAMKKYEEAKKRNDIIHVQIK